MRVSFVVRSDSSRSLVLLIAAFIWGAISRPWAAVFPARRPNARGPALTGAATSKDRYKHPAFTRKPVIAPDFEEVSNVLGVAPWKALRALGLVSSKGPIERSI